MRPPRYSAVWSPARAVVLLAAALAAAAPLFAGPAEDLLSVGKKAFAGGQYQLAADSFRRLGEDYPDSAAAEEAAYLLGVALFYQGSWSQSLSALSLLGVRYPKSSLLSRASYWTGAADLKLGNWQSALDTLSAFLADPAAAPSLRSSARLYRAIALEGLGRDPEAAAVYRQLLDAAPAGGSSTELNYRLAGTELRAGRYANARDLYGKVLLSPGGAPAGSSFVRDSVFFTGECELSLGNLAEAERRYRTILALYPGSPWVEAATFRLADISWRQRRPAAAGQVEDFLARFPNGSWRGSALRLHAEILASLKRSREAAAEYQRAAALLPDGAEKQAAWYALGQVQLGLGLKAAAVDPLGSAGSGPDPQLAEKASWRRAVLLSDLGRLPEAAEALQSFLQRFPASARAEQAGRLLGAIQEKQGGPEAARTSWDWLARTFPRSASFPQYLYLRGRAQLAAEARAAPGPVVEGQPADARAADGWAAALDDFQRVARDYPGTAWSARSTYSIGYVYARRGEYPRALPFFQAVSRDAAAGSDGPRGALSAAICLFDMGRFDRALAAFRALHAPFPAEASAGTVALYVGRSLYRLGRLAESASSLAGAAAALAAESSPLGADALYWRGWALLRLQKPADAFSSFLAVAEGYPSDPRHGEALFRAGVSKSLQGDDAAAVALFDQVIASAPAAAAPGALGAPAEDDASILEQAMYEKGLALARLGRGDDSTAALETLSRAFPGSRLAAQAFFSRAQAAFSRQDYAEAQAGFDRVVRSFPAAPIAAAAAYWWAECALRAGDAASALGGFWTCLAVSPSAPQAPLPAALLGASIDGFSQALRQSADPAAARQYAGQVRSAPGVQPEVRAGVLLAAAEVLLPAAPQEAGDMVEDVAADAPPEPYAGEANLMLGMLASARGDWNRALDILGSLEGSRADDVGARAALEKARALEAMGRTADAVDEYLKVGYLFPDLADRAAEGMFNAVRLARARGEVERAAKIEKALRSSYPASPWLQKLPQGPPG